jgi:hypothetical protein
MKPSGGTSVLAQFEILVGGELGDWRCGPAG